MKIDYKVLWIEDQPKEVTSYIESIRKSLSKLGFRLDLDLRKTLSEEDLRKLNTQLETYNPYDLVVFDYDLGKEKKDGAEIALSLRQYIYTDMIFYSSKSTTEMRKKLFDLEVDGVYVVTRPQLHNDATAIISEQIKKICDINNMRGVVLDEMSTLDRLFRAKLTERFKQLDPAEKKKQIKRNSDKFLERAKSNEKYANDDSEDNFIRMAEGSLIMDYSSIKNRLTSIGFFSGMKTELQETLSKLEKLRNEFAHKPSSLDQGKGLIVLEEPTHFPEGFGHDEFVEIRKEMIELSQIISKL